MSLVFHPSRIHIRQDQFQSNDWRDFYGDNKEELPVDMPEPLGEAIQMTAFVDSDHARQPHHASVTDRLHIIL